MNLFHVAPIPLGVGSVIEPGNFGRCIQLHPIGSFMAHREVVYEHTRQNEYPGKPSRLKSTFLLPTESEAIQYRDSIAPTNIVYEVEILDPNAKSHFTYIDLVCGAKNPPEPTSRLHSYAQNYWMSLEPFVAITADPLAMAEPSIAMGTGLQPRLREFLIESPIRIVRRLST